jgi:imidazolonepropionase-like amidohydrolase
MQYIMDNGLSMVAHAEEFIYTIFNNSTDVGQIGAVAAITATSGAYVTGTLSTYEGIGEIALDNQAGSNAMSGLLGKDGAEYLTGTRVTAWANSLQNTYNWAADLRPRLSFQQQFIKSFADAGVPILLGTDSPVIPGLVPGFSIHREMELLVEAGMSNYEVIYSGTALAGRFIAEQVSNVTPFGVVEIGNEASLVLLTHNPLDDITNFRKRAGVLSRGHWRSEEKLQELLENERR